MHLQCFPISYKLQAVWVNLIYKWFQYQELEVLTPKEREGTQNPHCQQAPTKKCRKFEILAHWDHNLQYEEETRVVQTEVERQ